MQLTYRGVRAARERFALAQREPDLALKLGSRVGESPAMRYLYDVRRMVTRHVANGEPEFAEEPLLDPRVRAQLPYCHQLPRLILYGDLRSRADAVVAGFSTALPRVPWSPAVEQQNGAVSGEGAWLGRCCRCSLRVFRGTAGDVNSTRGGKHDAQEEAHYNRKCSPHRAPSRLRLKKLRDEPYLTVATIAAT
jgi:hypothetical protein